MQPGELSSRANPGATPAISIGKSKHSNCVGWGKVKSYYLIMEINFLSSSALENQYIEIILNGESCICGKELLFRYN